jgi:steroid delta-isomerase-like uncharacterized protein
MSTEENKAIVRRWFDEVLSRGDMDALDSICAECHPQFAVVRGVMEPAPLGMSGLKSLITGLRSAFPDLQATVEEQIAEGDKVVTRVTMRGTQRGEFQGMPATGKAFSIPGVSIWEVRGNLLIQEWVSWDAMGMMQQLGAMPVPQGAAT